MERAIIWLIYGAHQSLSLSQVSEPTQPHPNKKKGNHADTRCNRQVICNKIKPIKLLLVNVNDRSILSRYSVYSACLGLWRSGHHSSVVKRNINVGGEPEENSAEDDTHKGYFAEIVS